MEEGNFDLNPHSSIIIFLLHYSFPHFQNQRNLKTVNESLDHYLFHFNTTSPYRPSNPATPPSPCPARTTSKATTSNSPTTTKAAILLSKAVIPPNKEAIPRNKDTHHSRAIRKVRPKASTTSSTSRATNKVRRSKEDTIRTLGPRSDRTALVLRKQVGSSTARRAGSSASMMQAIPRASRHISKSPGSIWKTTKMKLLTSTCSGGQQDYNQQYPQQGQQGAPPQIYDANGQPHQFPPQSSDKNAPNYDPNAPPMAEGERGLLGAIGGGIAGHHFGGKGGHGLLGTLGGAIAGSLLQDKLKKPKHGKHGSHSGSSWGGSSWGGKY